MAKRILVPLDQTAATGSIVPLVKDLATGAGATVRLLHVAPMPENVVNDQGRVVAYVDQEMVRLEADALDYLRTVEMHLDGVPVECVVRFGDPRREILREAEAFGADLIALTTGRRSRFPRGVMGGVPEHVARKAPVAVMLVYPEPSLR